MVGGGLALERKVNRGAGGWCGKELVYQCACFCQNYISAHSPCISPQRDQRYEKVEASEASFTVIQLHHCSLTCVEYCYIMLCVVVILKMCSP